MIKYMETMKTKGIKWTFEGREYIYKGEINEKGEPHGQGMLKTEKDIKRFDGSWKDGFPTGICKIYDREGKLKNTIKFQGKMFYILT